MFLQDLRYAVRTLARSPLFTAVAVACLALGIGVNSTIFSVVDGVLLQPHPYPDAHEIIVLNSANPKSGVNSTLTSWPDFEDYRDQNTTLATLAGFTGRSLTISDGSTDPERYSGATVTWTTFGLLGVRPALGRDFGPDDDRPGAEPVVLLSDDVWRRRYGGDPAVIGRAISINGRPHTIIGVMPPNFLFWENQRLWVPLGGYTRELTRRDRALMVLARMKPDVSIDQARSDLAGISSRLASTYPDANENWTLRVRPLREWMVPAQVRLMILAMMGAVTLVLLIACANVANLLLARASVRHREISVRSALGAGRWRIVRQLLTEAVVIGLVSAPLGVAIAWVGIQLLDRSIPPDSVPYFIHWSLDTRSLMYTVAIAMLTGIVFGTAPALQAARANLTESLKEGARGATGGRRARLRNALVVAEIAMSLVLLVGASLFVRSFMNLQNAALGFDPAPLMTMRFYLPGSAYEPADAKARRVQDIVRRVESLPGVEAAFASNFVPLAGGGGEGNVIVEGRAFERGREPSVAFVGVTPRMRATLDVALVRGRDLTEADDVTRTPVAIVNQSMAAQLWPDGDPIGRRFRLTGERQPDWFTVVGVVADFRHFVGDSDDTFFPTAYVPYSFDPTLNTGLTIRVASNPAQITGAVREEIRASDSTLPVFSTFTMDELRRRSYWQMRLFGWMFSTFGAVALLLASIGVYGVLSYSVSQRTQEIGVRMALGADRQRVLRLIVAHGLKLAAIGIALGVAGAAAATQTIASILYNVTPTDPLSFGGVILFLLAVAAAASYLPARRAMAVDPVVALRQQ
jgi:putative ABC transport system permease protein